MKTYSFFHRETGMFNGQKFSTDDPIGFALERQIPEGHEAIEGSHDHLSKRVDLTTGEVVDYQPPQPSDDHEWDERVKRWKLSASAELIRQNHRTAVAQIAMLENQSLRSMREYILGHEGALEKLQEIERKIVILREDIMP